MKRHRRARGHAHPDLDGVQQVEVVETDSARDARSGIVVVRPVRRPSRIASPVTAGRPPIRALPGRSPAAVRRLAVESPLRPVESAASAAPPLTASGLKTSTSERGAGAAASARRSRPQRREPAIRTRLTMTTRRRRMTDLLAEVALQERSRLAHVSEASQTLQLLRRSSCSFRRPVSDARPRPCPPSLERLREPLDDLGVLRGQVLLIEGSFRASNSSNSGFSRAA